MPVEMALLKTARRKERIRLLDRVSHLRNRVQKTDLRSNADLRSRINPGSQTNPITDHHRTGHHKVELLREEEGRRSKDATDHRDPITIARQDRRAEGHLQLKQRQAAQVEWKLPDLIICFSMNVYQNCSCSL
jgi:hypothetical protein